MTQAQPSGALWLDCTAGASGDMLLGALVGAGVPLAVPLGAVRATGLPIELAESRVQRGGLAATKIDVRVTEPDAASRTWREIRELLTAAPLESTVRDRALATFASLAAAEAAVHGVAPDDVHFHEVGGHDAVADIVGVSACFAHLDAEVFASPVAVGSGRTGSAHGSLPIPGPAVLELLRVACFATCEPPADAAGELCTPTGAALLAEFATGTASMPAMTVRAVGAGAGSRDPASHPNVVRAVLGARDDSVPAKQHVLAANVDDLDPRVWPSVLEALLAAGAADAWLTPIIMKKGRPAFTVSALAPLECVDAVRDALYRHTTTIGLRESPVTKHALDRDWVTVEVSGQPVRVKVGRAPDGTVLNAMPEWRDIETAAAALGRPVKTVLAAAIAECHPAVTSGP
jgi:uncharacterized protein (TIGR00299 family) protein